jgi:hypothetical protein
MYLMNIDLEEGFRATEAFIANGDDLTIRQLVALLKGRGWSGGGHFLLKVQCNVAKLFLKIVGNIFSALIVMFNLDVTDNFTLSCGGEWVTAFSEDFHQIVGQVTAGQIQTEDGMGQGITLVDGHGVGYTFLWFDLNI